MNHADEKVLQEKYDRLREDLKGMGSVAVAFSGGVDSTLLLWTAHDVLGGQAAAVTIRSESVPGSELREAEDFCEKKGIRRFVLDVEQLKIEGFSSNPPDRCYICKKSIFTTILDIAAKEGFACVAEGSNTDDGGDYRPGSKAVAELGIRSPLRDAGLSKAEIRLLSRRLGLPTWNRPSGACLSTRFVYGETITKEKLLMVERAEQFLRDEGFGQLRVRMHGESLARIEVPSGDLPRLIERRDRIVREFREIGFAWISADLAGYRTGSMNETLVL